MRYILTFTIIVTVLYNTFAQVNRTNPSVAPAKLSKVEPNPKLQGDYYANELSKQVSNLSNDQTLKISEYFIEYTELSAKLKKENPSISDQNQILLRQSKDAKIMAILDKKQQKQFKEYTENKYKILEDNKNNTKSK